MLSGPVAHAYDVPKKKSAEALNLSDKIFLLSALSVSFVNNVKLCKSLHWKMFRNNCSAWLRLKLITKVSLHNFPPPDPPFLPPQTFLPVIVMEKAQVKCSFPMIGN